MNVNIIKRIFFKIFWNGMILSRQKFALFSINKHILNYLKIVPLIIKLYLLHFHIIKVYLKILCFLAKNVPTNVKLYNRYCHYVRTNDNMYLFDDNFALRNLVELFFCYAINLNSTYDSYVALAQIWNNLICTWIIKCRKI